MSGAPKKLVVALGGNAISGTSGLGTIEEQFEQTRRTAQLLGAAIADGYQLILTHGNGPQVGNVLRRSEIASSELYPVPLEVCVADTQAGMGYMISQCLMNDLRERDIQQNVTTLVTSVVVDRHDPSFSQPSKPIGSRLKRAIAEAHERLDGWKIREIAPGQFRRIVPSPLPLAILEINTIGQIVESGASLVCCGGGGIPVYADDSGHYCGAAAVVDKDRTSALLARELGISTLVILTNVERVCLDFNQPTERRLSELSLVEAKTYLEAGQFAAGSMQPKMEAAIDFLEQSRVSNLSVLIGSLDRFAQVLAGSSGTRITR